MKESPGKYGKNRVIFTPCDESLGECSDNQRIPGLVLCVCLFMYCKAMFCSVCISYSVLCIILLYNWLISIRYIIVY